MWKASLVKSPDELLQILTLQKQNLKDRVSQSEKNEQGFVTLEHTLPILEKMHAVAPSVIIKENDKVVAYALTELPECRHLVPELDPMFELLNRLTWNDKPLESFRYYVMGQICVAKEFRGKGLFGALYLHHREVYQSRFDLFITQISLSNPRSIRAHEKVGFKTIHRHRDHKDDWLVVAWNWE